MPTLGAEDLVDIWEQGSTSGRAERAHLLLSRTRPDLSGEKLDGLPLGSRDAMLLQLREQMFGPWLKSVVECPHCHETLEINLDIRELRSGEAGENLEAEFVSNHLKIRFRVPTHGDLRNVENCNDLQEARRRLIGRCVLEVHRGGKKVEPIELTREETIALAGRVVESDPHAELILGGECPSCSHRWTSPLDIASFLWQELEVAVKRLLADVHALAWAYSWSERDILSMSERRRRFYLELLAR